MMQTEQQYFIFDFVLKKVSIEEKPLTDETRLTAFSTESDNKCPYVIPTVSEIMKLIDSTAYRIDKSKLLSDIFECGAIAISNQFDLRQFDEREKRYLQIINTYQPKERELIADIFGRLYALLSSVVYDNGTFNDWLGEIFMNCNIANSKAGQYFTPYHISHMMAKMTVNQSVVEEKRQNDGILTINEPCCGAGGMMLAALDVLKNDYKFNYAHNCLVVCEDIDLRCVHMCYLQLSLAGVPAIIKHQNSLSRELWSVWKTPAYIMQYLRFRKFEKEIQI